MHSAYAFVSKTPPRTLERMRFMLCLARTEFSSQIEKLT
jgi:hypothetical protein